MTDSVVLPLEAIESLDTKVVVALIAAFVSVALGILTVLMQYRTHREQIIEKRKEEKRREIHKKLNEFYGPFQQYLNASKEFYKILRKGKPNGFTVLTYLLNPEQKYRSEDGEKKIILNEGDKHLLDQIFHFGQKIEDLIVEKAGLVDDPELRYDFKIDPSISKAKLQDNGLLALAKVHFQIIRMAYSGKLHGEEERFKDYLFPRQLPDKIESRINHLQSELNELNS